ncbi:hypothetical protein IZ6_07900 [Terrihabitans soli]|uniref:Uncharacterized protein n=1 Tax=Terrihabitans soli TaxID=708113 RepID=A0A6S6QQL7_9HYPH|nr:hypothetical protein [Terrihabitans soli]BCJ90055.1 hypothetical protein IZ6_07900 [Terrihabitans soli]
MGSVFELTRRTILSQLPQAAFTHVQFTCAECDAVCRVPLDDLTWKQKINTLASAEPLMVCRCGGPAVEGSIGAWSPTNFYRGRR